MTIRYIAIAIIAIIWLGICTKVLFDESKLHTIEIKLGVVK